MSKVVRAYDDPELAYITHKFSRRCYCDGCWREKGRRLGRWFFIFVSLAVFGFLLSAVAAVGSLFL